MKSETAKHPHELERTESTICALTEAQQVPARAKPARPAPPQGQLSRVGPRVAADTRRTSERRCGRSSQVRLRQAGGQAPSGSSCRGAECALSAKQLGPGGSFGGCPGLGVLPSVSPTKTLPGPSEGAAPGPSAQETTEEPPALPAQVPSLAQLEVRKFPLNSVSPITRATAKAKAVFLRQPVVSTWRPENKVFIKVFIM